MRILVRVVCAATLCLAGCAPNAVSRQPPQPFTAPSTPATRTAVATGTPAAIPSLEFVDLTLLPKRLKVTPGNMIARGSYRPFLSGSHITSVEWVPGEFGAARTSVLHLQLDPAGTSILGRWTTANVGRQFVIVLQGRILAAPTIAGAITDGHVWLAGPGILRMRSLIDSATVPSE